jgi:hypothetical protein
MRVVTLLLVAALAVSCTDDKPKAESVRKYCALTSMPHSTAAELRAIDRRAIELFKQRTPYKATEVNRRVIRAATALSSTARSAALKIEQPGLFPGQNPADNLPPVYDELVAACAALPKSDR